MHLLLRRPPPLRPGRSSPSSRPRPCPLVASVRFEQQQLVAQRHGHPRLPLLPLRRPGAPSSSRPFATTRACCRHHRTWLCLARVLPCRASVPAGAPLLLPFLCYKPTPTFRFGQCSSPKFLLSIVIAHEAPCDVLCWTVKICKIDYMDAKTIPGPPSIVSMIFAKYHNDASSTSTVVSGNAKYPYARRRQVRFGIHQVPLPMVRTTTKRDVPLPTPRTTTSTTSRERLLPLHRSELVPPRMHASKV